MSLVGARDTEFVTTFFALRKRPIKKREMELGGEVDTRRANHPQVDGTMGTSLHYPEIVDLGKIPQ